MRPIRPAVLAALCAAAAACTPSQPGPAPTSQPTQPPAPTAASSQPTAEEAARFVADAEQRLNELDIAAERAAWVQANFITEDTQEISAAANQALIAAGVELAKQAARFNALDLPYDVRRKLDLLRLALTMPAPADPAKTKELATIAARMEAAYGEGKYCPPGKSGDECLDVEKIMEVFATSRDPARLLEVWQGWHAIGKPIRADYTRFVALTNEGARELGFADAGALWRSKYDMSPDEFAAEMDRLWGEVKPLYDSLHCYTRRKLAERYGENVVPAGKPIPAHLFGNIWAQEWQNIEPLVAPGKLDPGFDLTRILVGKQTDVLGMVRYGERFFTSLGFPELPKTFYERSLFTKPRDREVVCHASAWDIDNVDDLRIKMCIDINAEDFYTIHHELGHNFYQRAYAGQPHLYRDSANDGFHEAIGDAIALSVTPSYLVKVGLLAGEPDASRDVGLLLRRALDKVAFLPWGLLVDRWRWEVFSGKVAPDRYNERWWQLREQYQGVAAPTARTEEDFDPGAKYHIPGNTPYARYFLAAILQFQMHRAMCREAGYTGPLHRCTIYDDKKVGERLQKMLAMGMSRPWPEALEALTGENRMDATAMVEYFAPLKTWLDEQNQGQTCGW